MTITPATREAVSSETVALMLTGDRVTSGFRAALFAAAAREGLSVNEYVIRAAGEKLIDQGARFPGVFKSGDSEKQGGADPFAGSGHLVLLDIGNGYVADREKRAYEKARGTQSLFQWAVSLMKANVEQRARNS